MGGNSDKKESELLYLDRFYSEVRRIGYKVLDFISRGHFSKLERDIANSTEREVALAGRVVRLNNAHENEKREWAKRVGIKEAENDRLIFELSDTNKEVKRLEGRVAEAEGTLVLAHNQLEETKDAYDRVQAIIDANEELEGAMGDLEEYFAKIGVTGADVGRNALGVMRRQRTFVKMAYEKVEEAKEEVREAEKKGVLGRVYVKLEKKKAIFVLDEKYRIEAMSAAAHELIGRDITGKDSSYVASRLGLMMRYVAPTLEERFNVRVNSVGNLKNARINVNLERYYGQHIGSFLVIEPASWYKEVMVRKAEQVCKLVPHGVVGNSFGSELTKMVNQIIAPDGSERVAIDLRSTVKMSDEIAKRIGGLAQSNYFRNRMNIILGHGSVYDQLTRCGVPEEIMFGGYEKGRDLEAVPVPVKP